MSAKEQGFCLLLRPFIFPWRVSSISVQFFLLVLLPFESLTTIFPSADNFAPAEGFCRCAGSKDAPIDSFHKWRPIQLGRCFFGSFSFICDATWSSFADFQLCGCRYEQLDGVFIAWKMSNWLVIHKWWGSLVNPSQLLPVTNLTIQIACSSASVRCRAQLDDLWKRQPSTIFSSVLRNPSSADLCRQFF